MDLRRDESRFQGLLLGFSLLLLIVVAAFAGYDLQNTKANYLCVTLGAVAGLSWLFVLYRRIWVIDAWMKKELVSHQEINTLWTQMQHGAEVVNKALEGVQKALPQKDPSQRPLARIAKYNTDLRSRRIDIHPAGDRIRQMTKHIEELTEELRRA